MAKYQYIVCSNGRIALYEKKDFENAVSLEKSLLIICNGVAYIVGADRIDDNNYSCYTIKVKNITYTAEELQQQAENRKARLLADAESVILPLERAVRLNMATDEERSRLEAWERYSVLVSRVDPANPEWPEMPQEVV